MTPENELLAAVRSGDAVRVAELLEADAKSVRVADEHGKTALHWAAELDRADLGRALLEAGADPEARTSWGATPLDWAAWMGSRDTAELLLARGAGPLTLIQAAALGRLAEVAALVEAGGDLFGHRRRDAPAEPDEHWPADSAHHLGDVLSDALFAAARNGHAPVVRYLLDRGAHVDAKGVFGATGLHWAALFGHASTVELLLARGADRGAVDSRFRSTPSGWALEGGHQGLAARLAPDGGARPPG